MKFIKNNKRNILAFIIGALLSGGIVYAAVAASAITYDNTISGLKKANGQDVTTAQEALDALAEKVNKIECKDGYIKQNEAAESYECNVPQTQPQIETKFKNMILADNDIVTEPLSSSDLQSIATSTSNPPKIYKMSVTNSFGGGSGDTYFFRGALTNNVVEFANLTWRIVRINEDGTVRLILDTTINNNSRSYQYSTAYSGYTYMYYSESGNYMKKTLNDWYAANITGTDATKVATGNYFCEAAKVVDSSSYNTTTETSFMTTATQYTPTLDCTTDANTKGLVSANIGLITYDELVLAGLKSGDNNQSYYLYKTATGASNGTYWWTMSPAGVDGSSSEVWYVNYGTLSSSGSGDLAAVRPVINLKADVDVTKDETTGHYIIQ